MAFFTLAFAKLSDSIPIPGKTEKVVAAFGAVKTGVETVESVWALGSKIKRRIKNGSQSGK